MIFLTVLSDDIYEEAALAGGAVDFIDKSRRLPILLKRLQLIAEGGAAGGRSGPAAGGRRCASGGSSCASTRTARCGPGGRST